MIRHHPQAGFCVLRLRQPRPGHLGSRDPPALALRPLHINAVELKGEEHAEAATTRSCARLRGGARKYPGVRNRQEAQGGLSKKVGHSRTTASAPEELHRIGFSS